MHRAVLADKRGPGREISAEIRNLVAEGASLEVKTAARETALTLAMSSGRQLMFVHLLQFGANADVLSPALGRPGKKQHSPLLTASGAGTWRFVQPLLEAGASVDFANPDDGLTPLMFAADIARVKALRPELSSSDAQFNHTRVIELLLQAGAQPTALDKVGNAAASHLGDFARAAGGGTSKWLHQMMLRADTDGSFSYEAQLQKQAQKRAFARQMMVGFDADNGCDGKCEHHYGSENHRKYMLSQMHSLHYMTITAVQKQRRMRRTMDWVTTEVNQTVGRQEPESYESSIVEHDDL